MRSHRTAVLLAALAVAAQARAEAQERPRTPADSVKAAVSAPGARRSVRVQKDGTPAAPASAPAPAPTASVPAPAAPVAESPPVAAAGPAVNAAPAASAAPSASPGEWRRRLALVPLRERVVAVPGVSVSSPTAFALHRGEAFVGGAYQARTRYTDLQDGALAVGAGFGDRDRLVGLEVVATSYATVNDGGPFADGSLSAKVHRAIGPRVGVAVGVENGVHWGEIDAGTSVYGSATGLVRLRDRESAPFSSAALTVGVGNGRFRSEDDVLAGRETVNFFGAVALRVADPVVLIADWTGQDLYAAVSLRPLRRLPLVATIGAADVTGSAGDGARLIASVGYGFRIPRIP